jgi:hypothetical protein
MSYAPVMGLGALPAVPSAPTSADVQNEIRENLPYADELEAKYNEYNQFAQQAKALSELSVDDLEREAVQWAETTAKAYAKEYGIPTTQAELRAIAEGKLDQYLQSATGISIQQISNLRNLESASKEIVIAGASSALGVNPRLAAVTVEALADLELDENDLRSIGSTAGSIAGAALCQSFGIPAPIGAFIGGQLGGLVGGAVGSFFCSGMSASEIEDEMRKATAAARAELDAVRQQVQKVYDEQIFPAYWGSWDKLLADVEKGWMMREVKAGARFQVRWFGRSKSWFTTYTVDPTKCSQPNLGPCFDLNKVSPQAKTGASRRVCYSPAGSSAETCVTKYNYLCNQNYGCLYPTFPNLGAGSYERAAQALAGQGAFWRPPAYRTRLVLPGPTNDEVSRTVGASTAAAKEKYGIGPYRSRLFQMVQRDTSFGGPSSASLVVVGDLSQTGAYVKIERDLLKSATEKNSRILKERFRAAQLGRAAAFTSSALSNIALVGGLGLAGYAGYKLWRSR